MDSSTALTLILGLAGVVGTLGGGIITYLVRQLDKRDAQIERLTTGQQATNDLNRQLAELYIRERQVAGGSP